MAHVLKKLVDEEYEHLVLSNPLMEDEMTHRYWPRTTKLNVGLYAVAYNLKSYELERYPDGSWLLFRIVRGERKYLNDYATKRGAVDALGYGQADDPDRR